MNRFILVALMSLLLMSCGGGGESGNSDSQQSQTGNLISVLGVDGEMAGADGFIYRLQDYLNSKTAATNLLANSDTTDVEMGLADNLELSLDAGLGPFVVIIKANNNTIDLTTGEKPVFKIDRRRTHKISDFKIDFKA